MSELAGIIRIIAILGLLASFALLLAFFYFYFRFLLPNVPDNTVGVRIRNKIPDPRPLLPGLYILGPNDRLVIYPTVPTTQRCTVSGITTDKILASIIVAFTISVSPRHAPALVYNMLTSENHTATHPWKDAKDHLQPIATETIPKISSNNLKKAAILLRTGNTLHNATIIDMQSRIREALNASLPEHIHLHELHLESIQLPA